MVCDDIYTVFKKVVSSINPLGETPCFISNIPLGRYFNESITLSHLNNIVQDNLLTKSTSSKAKRVKKYKYKLASQLKGCFSDETRLAVFLLIYNRIYNGYPDDVISSFKHAISDIAESFSIDDDTLQAIDCFYKNKYLADIHHSYYEVSPDFNPLLSASGAKVNYKGNIGEISYFKWLPAFQVLLHKKTQVIRRYSELTDELKHTGIDIITELDFIGITKQNLSFKELTAEISKPAVTRLINISRKESYPHILLDPDNGKIVIEGVSTPVSPLTYLEPILAWMDLYSRKNTSLDILFKFYYYNTYTTKFLVRFIEKCNALYAQGMDITIEWSYSESDTDILEYGDFYKDLFINKNGFKLIAGD